MHAAGSPQSQRCFRALADCAACCQVTVSDGVPVLHVVPNNTDVQHTTFEVVIRVGPPATVPWGPTAHLLAQRLLLLSDAVPSAICADCGRGRRLLESMELATISAAVNFFSMRGLK